MLRSSSSIGTGFGVLKRVSAKAVSVLISDARAAIPPVVSYRSVRLMMPTLRLSQVTEEKLVEIHKLRSSHRYLDN